MYQREQVSHFRDRATAGRRLADLVAHHASARPIVVGLFPGGVVVGAEIARAIGAPLDVMEVKSVRAPDAADAIIGAVALGDVAFFEPSYVYHHGLTIPDLQRLTVQAAIDAKRRTRRLRGRAALPPVGGRPVILAADGIASRASMLAAIWALRTALARHMIVAVGIGPPDVVSRLREDADEVHCLLETEHLGEISLWYEDFEAVEDHVVVKLLAATNVREARSARPLQAMRIKLPVR